MITSLLINKLFHLQAPLSSAPLQLHANSIFTQNHLQKVKNIKTITTASDFLRERESKKIKRELSGGKVEKRIRQRCRLKLLVFFAAPIGRAPIGVMGGFLQPAEPTIKKCRGADKTV
ncbi:hypothetical protein CEXT_187061 [Caerostris extrusa]|uniref:Uncharacterized protein n=1 Tax=Caerostris extrusa TaxID=172846 RepID=A0AAV4XCU3_CAEEX|nr:hypothetical protein CEXT_187061 [Caerostris extrusa]